MLSVEYMKFVFDRMRVYRGNAHSALSRLAAPFCLKPNIAKCVFFPTDYDYLVIFRYLDRKHGIRIGTTRAVITECFNGSSFTSIAPCVEVGAGFSSLESPSREIPSRRFPA